nr:SlyX family protein [Vibrio mexicanus]
MPNGLPRTNDRRLKCGVEQQQLLITKMQDQMKYVVGKVKNMDTPNMADPSEETPPPHY